MKELKPREYIYQDYLALTLGGKREVRLPTIGNKSIDVLTNTHVIEVKYARAAEVDEVWTQVTKYWRATDKTRIPQIFPIWSADRINRNIERREWAKQYQEEQRYRSEPVELLPGIIERDVTPVYKIGDFEFSNRTDIERHLDQIKCDFLASGYLCDPHREFIACLVEAYRLVHHRNDLRLFTYDISSIDCFGQKMSIVFHEGNLDLNKCISALIRKTHYDLLAAPASIDEISPQVGVVRYNISKQKTLDHLPHPSGGEARYLSRLIPYAERQYSERVDHRLVMRGFPFYDSSPREKFDILWRIEPDGSALIQSNIRPDWSNCLPATNFQVNEFELPTFEVGDRLRFRLAFNSISRYKGRDRMVEPKDWLSRHPFGAELDVRSINTEIVTDSSHGHRVLVRRATCEGMCTVTDVALLKQAIANGVGRARAYGCGLLSVRR